MAKSVNNFKDGGGNPIIVWKPVVEQDFGQERFSLAQKIQYESILYIFKVKNSLLKSNYDLITNVSISNKNTRNSHVLRPPNYKKA